MHIAESNEFIKQNVQKGTLKYCKDIFGRDIWAESAESRQGLVIK